jgi:hypothetical protein
MKEQPSKEQSWNGANMCRDLTITCPREAPAQIERRGDISKQMQEVVSSTDRDVPGGAPVPAGDACARAPPRSGLRRLGRRAPCRPRALAWQQPAAKAKRTIHGTSWSERARASELGGPVVLAASY